MDSQIKSILENRRASNSVMIIGDTIVYDKYPFETLRSSFYAFACSADTVAAIGNGLSYHQVRRLRELSVILYKFYLELNKWQIDEKQMDLF